MNKKAVALLSGGLDSTLAVKVMIEQGIDVVALNFISAFCTCNCRTNTCKSEAKRVADEFGIPIKILNKGLDYIEIIRKPQHGYGKAMNPCIDCRIYIHKLAKLYMEEIGASFIITGEVLGQRPMSQRREVFQIIEKECGLEGLIVRPLSAQYLQPTIPEELGIIDRKKLMDMIGRSRKPQIALAEGLDIHNYPCPSGGCLLTDKIFSKRIRDLLEHKKEITTKDLYLLRVGRHFRLNKETKVIIGRDEDDNRKIINLVQHDNTLIEPLDFQGPTGLVCGPFENETKPLVGGMILRYSGKKNNDDIGRANKKIIKLSINGEITNLIADLLVDNEILKRMLI